MSIIKPNKSSDIKIDWRIRVKSSVHKKIKDYCNWAGIKNKNHFFESVCKYVLENDEEWKQSKSK